MHLEAGAHYQGTLLAANRHQQTGFVSAAQGMSAMGYIAPASPPRWRTVTDAERRILEQATRIA